MRLNKYLALCGLGSRRAVEHLITGGQVAVGGKTVGDLATQVDEARDAVTVLGRPVRPVARHNFDYILLNKPRGYDVTRGGRQHHRRAWDLLPKDTHASVQAVGRLDRDSTGLLLFTNDGELAFRLTHPRYGCRKVYEVKVEGTVKAETLKRLTDGVQLEDGPAHAVHVERLAAEPDGLPRLLIVMEEGRNRIVRRMCEALEHPVTDLNRTALGPLQLGAVPRGKTRVLTTREIHLLRRLVGLAGGEEEKKARSVERGTRKNTGGTPEPSSHKKKSPMGPAGGVEKIARSAERGARKDTGGKPALSAPKGRSSQEHKKLADNSTDSSAKKRYKPRIHPDRHG